MISSLFSPPEASSIQKIAVLNFGGIGDEILFSPVIDELKKYLPHASLHLILEKRSQGIGPLLPRLNLSGSDLSEQQSDAQAVKDKIISVDLSQFSRANLLTVLSGILSRGRYDAVLSSGSSPFIAPMLFLGGVRYRVGYDVSASMLGKLTRCFLSQAAPLNQQQYASDMYFSLAQTFLQGLLGDAYQPPDRALPVLALPPQVDQDWAAELLASLLMAGVSSEQKRILIHPGVSLMSVQKNILKGWPAVHWVKLIHRLAAREDCVVLLAGGPDDARIIEEIAGLLTHVSPAVNPARFQNLYGKTKSLTQLAALIQQADVLLSVDSAPMHLAVGYGVPVVAMFGPTDEKKLLPPRLPGQSQVFRAVTQDHLSCRPCLWDVRKVSCDQPVCLDVSVDRMESEVLDLLSLPVGGRAASNSVQ